MSQLSPYTTIPHYFVSIQNKNLTSHSFNLSLTYMPSSSIVICKDSCFHFSQRLSINSLKYKKTPRDFSSEFQICFVLSAVDAFREFVCKFYSHLKNNFFRSVGGVSVYEIDCFLSFGGRRTFLPRTIAH